MSDSRPAQDGVIPAAPGTYTLLLRCRAARRIRIGSLGLMRVRPGWYAYVGSAFGPGGLAARISHHRRVAAPPLWHIDYLRRYAPLESVFYCEDRRCEHEWAAAMGATPGAVLPSSRSWAKSVDAGRPANGFLPRITCVLLNTRAT